MDQLRTRVFPLLFIPVTANYEKVMPTLFIPLLYTNYQMSSKT